MEPSSGGQQLILAKVYKWFNGASPYSQCGDDVAGRLPATSWVRYTTNCNTQSSAPEDG